MKSLRLEFEVSSKKLKKTVAIGINTPIDTNKEDRNQIFKFFNIKGLII